METWYSTDTITYLGREIIVRYDYNPAEESTNTGESIDIISIRYNDRLITRMVNHNHIEDIILEKLKP